MKKVLITGGTTFVSKYAAQYFKEHNYDVYVRSYNAIKNYKEDEIERYMVRHKYLNDEEIEYQYNAING